MARTVEREERVCGIVSEIIRERERRRRGRASAPILIPHPFSLSSPTRHTLLIVMQIALDSTLCKLSSPAFVISKNAPCFGCGRLKPHTRGNLVSSLSLSPLSSVKRRLDIRITLARSLSLSLVCTQPSSHPLSLSLSSSHILLTLTCSFFLPHF